MLCQRRIMDTLLDLKYIPDRFIIVCGQHHTINVCWHRLSNSWECGQSVQQEMEFERRFTSRPDQVWIVATPRRILKNTGNYPRP
jgi:hypothetical protein